MEGAERQRNIGYTGENGTDFLLNTTAENYVRIRNEISGEFANEGSETELNPEPSVDLVSNR